MENSKSRKIATKFVKDKIKYFPWKSEDRENIFNDRPISVFSVKAGISEKLIHGQVSNSYFNDYLYKNQSGFRPKSSTQSALLKILLINGY